MVPPFPVFSCNRQYGEKVSSETTEKGISTADNFLADNFLADNFLAEMAFSVVSVSSA